MSRKATITQEEIVNAAFKITKKEGFDQKDLSTIETLVEPYNNKA